MQSQAARPPSKWTPFDDAPVADPRLRLTPDDNPPSAEPAAADLSLFDPENSPRDLYDVAAAGNNGTLAPTAQGRNTIARTSRVSSAPLGGGIRCKGCDRSYSLGTRVCVECGIDLKTGRPLITAQGIDENALQVYTEGLIRVISYFIAFGLYPIASEAFGVCKPYLVWAIAILTVMTSIGFWAQESGANGYERDAANRLMLHVGRVSSEQVVDIYEAPEIGPTNPLVRQYLAEKERLKGSVPPDDLPAQAYQALPEGARLLDPGDFHAYQLLTNAFLHAGLLHLAGNMLFLLVFGTRVNALLGQVRTAILYPVLAVAASAVYAVSASNEAPHLALGASGAIMGLAGMYLIFFPMHKVHNVIWLRIWLYGSPAMKIFTVRGFWVVLFFIAFDVVYTAFGLKDGVAHWAHLGGFLTGATLALLMLLSGLADARGGDLLSVIAGKKIRPLVRLHGALPQAA